MEESYLEQARDVETVPPESDLAVKDAKDDCDGTDGKTSVADKPDMTDKSSSDDKDGSGEHLEGSAVVKQDGTSIQANQNVEYQAAIEDGKPASIEVQDDDKQAPLPQILKRRAGTPGSKKPPSLTFTAPDNLPRRFSNAGHLSYKRPPTPFVGLNTFGQLMTNKAKPIPAQLQLLKPKIDLLKVAPPMTPMTPALKDLLTPSQLRPSLVPLNVVSSEERPLFIVHPITGQITLLEKLGGSLQLPCYGLQRTPATPSDSIGSVASYYRNSIERRQAEGPYRIAGYSFGAMIALEIALQLQAEGMQVESLILFDGSPGYVSSMISQAIQHLPADATREQLHEALETGALLNWMSFFGPVQHRDLTFGLLRKLPTLENKIETAVDLTLGNALLSPNQKVTKWLTAKEKILKSKGKSSKDGIYTAAMELIRLKRREKAEVFVMHAVMSVDYKPTDKFHGDIHLHRVKSEPIFKAASLPPDYDLQRHCTGQVHVHFHSGDHESFISKDAVTELQTGIHKLLNVK